MADEKSRVRQVVEIEMKVKEALYALDQMRFPVDLLVASETVLAVDALRGAAAAVKSFRKVVQYYETAGRVPNKDEAVD